MEKRNFEKKVLENLATISKRFGSVDRVLETIDKRTETTGKRIDGLERRIDELDKNLNDLAIMTARGFEETATKAELEEVQTRLDRIENILLRDHNNRIERLEDKLLQVEVILGKRLS